MNWEKWIFSSVPRKTQTRCYFDTIVFFCVPGSVDKGVVEVTNCFCVPHKEHDDQVEAELSYALDLYDLNRKVNPNENVVGK